MKTLILNDLHLGVRRMGGCTAQSRKDLEDWMMEQFKECLKVPHDKLVIAGDLCDKRNIPEHLMKQVIDMLRREDCTVLNGNHDSQSGDDGRTMSSTEFIALMSNSKFIKEPTEVDNLFLIPHMHEQLMLDKALQACPDGKIIITHVNLDSPWAHSDHSLNVSLPQLKDLSDRGVKLITGHEHKKRSYAGAEALGNNFPSSIADCLGGNKYAHVLEDGELTSHKTWCSSNYCEGTEIVDGAKFINITGTCELSEYANIVKEVAELRKRSDAFIVKNSVKIREHEQTVSAEEITEFNIINMLVDAVHPDFKKDVESCI